MNTFPSSDALAEVSSTKQGHVAQPGAVGGAGKAS